MARGLPHGNCGLKLLARNNSSIVEGTSIVLRHLISSQHKHDNKTTATVNESFSSINSKPTYSRILLARSLHYKQHQHNIYPLYEQKAFNNLRRNCKKKYSFGFPTYTLLREHYNHQKFSLSKKIRSVRSIHTMEELRSFRANNNESGENSNLNNKHYSFEEVLASQFDSPTHNKPDDEVEEKDSFCLDNIKNGPVNENGTTNKDPLEPKDIKIPIPFGHIAAQVWGNPNAKIKILALHGWLDNSGTFDNLLPLLIDTEDYHVVAYDDIGTGLSSHVPDGILYDRSLLIVTARRVIKYLGWKEYMIMGHSLGSITGMSYASIYPNEVKRIISIDSVMPPVFKSISWQGKARSFIEDGINHKVDKTNYTYDDALKRVIEGHMRSLTFSDAKTLMKRGVTRVEIPGQKPMYVFNRDVRLRTLFMEFQTDKHILETYRNIKSHLLILRSTIVDHQQLGDLESFYKCYKEVTASFKEELISGTHHIHLGNPRDCADAIKRWMHQCDAIEDKLVKK